MPDALEPAHPLRLNATVQAREDVRQGAAWLARIGGDVERFTSAFAEASTALVSDIGERLASGIGLPPVSVVASEEFGAPVLGGSVAPLLCAD